MNTQNKKPTVKELSKRIAALEAAITRQDMWLGAIDKIAGGLAHLSDDITLDEIRAKYAEVKKLQEDNKPTMVEKLQQGFEPEQKDSK